MKKIVVSLMLGLVALAAQASDVWSLQGTDYTVDTLFHNQVGPGTTTTSLWFRQVNGNDALRVFYATIDMTNPYVSLRGVCATDKLAGNERISAMAQRKSQPGAEYFLGINADFFTTSGTTSRGVSKVGSPVGSTVVDGVIFRGRTNTKTYKNFIVDTEGQVYVNPFTFAGTVTKTDGTKATIGGLNIPSVNNKITIYNDLYYGSTDEAAGNCEVAARLCDGETFHTAKPCKMVIVGAPSTAGDMTIEANHYVILGKGTAVDFVAAMQECDTITVSPTWKFGSLSVEPQQVISGNPKILEDGVTLQSEGDRTDASARHPRSAVGYSDDGKKVYFLVVDGRSAISSGVRTTWLADIMRYAGATDGMNVDGGGSAVLYTKALGIRNHPSDGSERADGNGFYAVSSAPDDDKVASIRFVDWALKTPKYGVYTPKFYGYNQYGKLIDTDVKGVKLSCDPELGHIIGDTTFYADGNLKVGTLTATVGDAVLHAPVEILDGVDAIAISNDSIVTDGINPYAVAVKTTVFDKEMAINPAALIWQSLDESVVTIDAETGVLKGLKNGSALVVGRLGEMTDTMLVNVEIPTAHVMPMDPNLDVATWKITQTGGTAAVATSNGNGIDYTYTGASGRAPKILLSKSLRLWSVPDTIRLRINPGEAPVKNVVLGLRANGETMSYQTIEPETIEANKEITLDLPTSAFTDPADLGKFPVVLSSIQLNMNTSTTGQVYEMHFNGFELVYKSVADVPLLGDVNGDGVVNVADVTAMVNIILLGGNDTRADVNNDNVVNVSDVSALVNIILGQ